MNIKSWVGLSLLIVLAAALAYYGLTIPPVEEPESSGRPIALPRRQPAPGDATPVVMPRDTYSESLATAVGREGTLALTVPPLGGLLPDTPLVFQLWNVGKQPVSGTMQLLLVGDPQPHFQEKFADLAPGAAKEFTVFLSNDLPVPARHEWPFLVATVLTNGQRSRMAFSPEFRVVPQARRAPRVDGDLSDWTDAPPLRLDRAAFIRDGGNAGAFATAVLRMCWDEKNLYAAVEVSDPTFRQAQAAEDMLREDAVALKYLAQNSVGLVTYGLAFLPAGPAGWRWSAFPGELTAGQVGARVFNGTQTYEAAFPWSDLMGTDRPVAGKVMRFDFGLSDADDQGRRWLTRYPEDQGMPGGAIALIAANGQTTGKPWTSSGLLLDEDFMGDLEADTGLPAGWAVTTTGRLKEREHTHIVPEVGRDKRTALVMDNPFGFYPGEKLTMAKLVEGLEPGQMYELIAWIRAPKIESTQGLVGVADDEAGQRNARNASWDPGAAWQRVAVPFRADTPTVYVVLRNQTGMEGTTIDRVTLRKIQ